MQVKKKGKSEHGAILIPRGRVHHVKMTNLSNKQSRPRWQHDTSFAWRDEITNENDPSKAHHVSATNQLNPHPGIQPSILPSCQRYPSPN
jgi:hypothetical protein